jgi:DNA-binding LytR/AlgR family response regulator
MKVLIVEDEPLACERLEKLLHDYDPSIHVQHRIDTVAEATAYLQEQMGKLDLVFLDVQLADGKSFEIFNKIKYPHPVVFTTAYDEYALSAFKLNSIDYLLKPIKPEELSNAIDKFKNIKKENSRVPVIDRELIASILDEKNNTQYKQRFLVKLGNRIQFKLTAEAAYFSADGKVCYMIHAPSGQRYIVDHTLEELDSDLLDPTRFFRISRQHIVNIDCIREMKNEVSGRPELLLSLPIKEKLYVSRTRTVDFKNWMNK